MITHRDRVAWLDWRADPAAHRVGASEVAIVLGLSPWREPWQLWAERCAPHLVSAERGAELEDGQAWEPRALQIYAAEHLGPISDGLWLTTEPHTSHPHPIRSCSWLHATPDGHVWGWQTNGREAVVGLVEVKTDRTPGADLAWPADGSEVRPADIHADLPVEAYPVPAHYWLQAQAQLACTGALWCDLYVWLPRFAGMPESRRVRIWPHPGFGGVIEQVARWRDRHLIGGEPPPVRDEDDAGRLALVRWRYPEPDVERDATPEEVNLMGEIIARREREQELERERKRLSVQLRESMREARVVRAPGAKTTISKSNALLVVRS